MKKKQTYILMYQDDEVLRFEVTFAKRNKVTVLEKLAHFDKAPYGMKEDSSQEELDRILFKFFNVRALASTRWDYEQILKATKCRDDFELSFKGHGLSLSNHYWYRKEDEILKYADINFFTNKWDDSFARAVLKGDYEALKDVDLNVPDIVTQGWAVKGWLCTDEGPKLYKLGIAQGQYEECLGEVLASRLATRLFNNGEVLEYKLEKIYDKYASVSKAMLTVDEELVPLSNILPVEAYFTYKSIARDHSRNDKFFKMIEDCTLPGLKDFFVKLSCLRTLCFVNDLHFDNISVIRNMKTGDIRIAPLYDLGGSFGSSSRGKEFLSKLDKSTFFLIYFFYGHLESNWDYSWYEPHKLDGFEDEIREVLSKSEFYTPTLIENIINVYQRQKASLDEMKKAHLKA